MRTNNVSHHKIPQVNLRIKKIGTLKEDADLLYEL